MQNVDVLGFGTATLDYVANVEAWPAEGVKAPVTGLSVHGGGLIGTALVAVSRLGGKASMVTKLGRSEVASAVVDGLEKEGIDTSMIIREDGAEPIVAFVFTTSGTGERTIFHSKDKIRFPELEELPDRDWPAKTGCILIDHYAAEPSLDAARAARENGIPIVIDFEREYPGVSEGLALATHMILGEAFAGQHTGAKTAAGMMNALRTSAEQTLIITRGGAGCVVSTPDGEFEYPAFPVEVVDTTGCGDVFHGAYALALSRSMNPMEAVRLATGAAALCATRLGGRDGIPTMEELEKFLAAEH